MANTPEQEKKIQEEILRIKQLISQLNQQDRDFYEKMLNSLNKSKDTLFDFEKLTDKIRDEVDDISNSLRYIQDSFKDSVNELQKQNVHLNSQKSALNKLSDIAKNILNIRRGDSDLDTKKLAKLRLETKERIDQLVFSKKRENITDDEIEVIRKQIEDAKILFGTFNKVLEVNEEINKQLGIGPTLAGGIDKALSKLGLPELGFKAAIDEVQRLGQEADSLGDKNFNAWKTYTGIIWNNFKGIFTTSNLIQGSIALIIDTFKSVDSAIGDLAKGLDMSYNSAANLRMELTDIANFSGDAAVNTKGLQESLMAVSQTLGINARLSSEDLVTFTKLREQAGYTNDELTSMQRITTITGGSLEKNSKTFLGTIGRLNAQNKLAINAKQLFKDIANVSDAIKLSVGGTAEKIATAAFKAKQFGINLQQADGIASSLLDFESSIANELSAELITGKDLNLERARLLAINGDIAGASAEILKQVGGTAEFTKMNRIQQEALAKSVGMNREDLAKSLVDREASAKLGAKEGQSAQDKYNELVKSYGVEKASAMLGDEALARQFQQQSVQERFAQSIEKLKEIFVSLVEPLMPVFDVFADIMGVVGPIVGVLGTMVKYAVDFGKYLLIPLGIMKGFQLVMTGIAATQAFINGLTVKDNASKATGNVLLGIGNFLTAGIFSTKTKQSALDTISLMKMYGLVGLEQTRYALQNQSLGVQVRVYAMQLREKAMLIAGNVLRFIRNTLGLTEIGIQNASNKTAGKGLMVRVGEMIASMFKAGAEAPPPANLILPFVFGAIAGGIGGALIAKYAMKDGVIDPRKGPIMSGGFGSVQLDPKDKAMYGADGTIKVGTNLGGGKGNSQQSTYMDPALLNEMRAMRQEQLQRRNNYVMIENSVNGTKFGTSLAMNTYKIQ